ncbi:hypothetical protein ALO62_200107 [Pseudomonas amygdali pv. myricae]|nr:hypothetical protein ALO62_200107 [Pseudomonas amygdali pv. myricae]
MNKLHAVDRVGTGIGFPLNLNGFDLRKQRPEACWWNGECRVKCLNVLSTVVDLVPLPVSRDLVG